MPVRPDRWPTRWRSCGSCWSTAHMASCHRWSGGDRPHRRGLPPMDELRPPRRRRAQPGLLGDVVLCPEVAARQGKRPATPGRRAHLLTVHGILHPLGYDHAEPDEENEMFDLQAAIPRGLARRAGESSVGTPRLHPQPPACWWSWPGSPPWPRRRSRPSRRLRAEERRRRRAARQRNVRSWSRPHRPLLNSPSCCAACRDHRRALVPWRLPGRFDGTGRAVLVAAAMVVVSFVVSGSGRARSGASTRTRRAWYALLLTLARVLGPLATPAHPHRQRGDAGSGLPGGAVRERGRAARAGRPSRGGR